MKAKIIKTGEIVQIVSNKFEMGCVTVLHENNKFSDIHSFEVEMIDDWEKKEIDWEQRRYEIAKDVLAGLVSAHQSGLTDAVYDSLEAIEYADELIKQLKSK